jgi:hypothetical protein
MTKTSESRREFCAAGAVGGIALLVGAPQKSYAIDPYMAGALIGAIATGVMTGLNMLISRNKDAEIALEQEKRRITQQKIDYLFEFLPASDKLLLFQNGTYMSAVLSGDLDGFGSIIGVRNGQLYVARDYTGGKIHSDMARPMQAVMNETGRLPIPTSHLKATEYRQGTDNATAYIADKMGINQEEYLRNRAPKIISPMSLARSPRQGGEDFAFLTTLNRSNGYVSNGKQYAALEVNPVPMKVMRR